MSEGPPLESLRPEEDAPSDSFGETAIEDSPIFPTFSAGVIREAQDLGTLDLDMPHDGEDPFNDLFTGIEDVSGTSDESDLFHRAAEVYREACSRSQNELRQYEADLQLVTGERNSLILLLGQMEEKIEHLRAELAKAYRDQTDLSEQLQQKIEMIGKLREEVDVIKAESLQRKKVMDHFAVEKETARAQLSSAKTQLQRMKEKGLVQARRIEELEARSASEFVKAKSDAEKAKVDVDALVAVYRADAEAAQIEAREATDTSDTRAHWVAELAKCRSRRETLEEIHARGFDLVEEIKRAKELEADAEALDSDGDDDNDDDDDGSKSGSENGEEPGGEETAPGDNPEA
ncbi:KNR4/SMI1 homolog [Nicotiana tomentosiformis]|uniref:KNR4/SMI1 homolog n=1 Tax=Nicotiana tomentosiformis TaxID=4098 RepID=UPI00388C5C97